MLVLAVALSWPSPPLEHWPPSTPSPADERTQEAPAGALLIANPAKVVAKPVARVTPDSVTVLATPTISVVGESENCRPEAPEGWCPHELGLRREGRA